MSSEVNFDVKSFDVTKFDSILARGLSHGLGEQGSQVCIEAAICETLGLDHDDDPKCVTASVRSFKIALNDSKWSSPEARAKGLRDLGLAQLGSLGVVNDVEFVTKLSKKVIGVLIPKLFRELFSESEELQRAADRCEKESSVEAANAVADAAYAARAATHAAANAAAYAAAAAARAATHAAAHAAAYAAAYAARASNMSVSDPDTYLVLVAQLALETLREMDSPGVTLI